MATLKRPWEASEVGLNIVECHLLYVAWADDTWLVAESSA